MKKDIDELLKQALTPNEEPDFWLNQRILNQVKETNRMNIKKAGRIPAAALAAAVVIGAGSISTYAAWKYLTPDEVAESLKDSSLTDAFKSTDAVIVNEQQSYGKYHFTLLGMVSGKDISKYERRSNGELLEDRTYCVTAIENADGTPMPNASDGAFFISPLIKGCDPAEYNMQCMHGGDTEFVEDGIMYRLTECDNVEIFADHGLYLCVCDGPFYRREAYNYDEETGEISRNEEYDGLNLLFQLPVDASKADSKAAAEYLKKLQEKYTAENTNAEKEAAGDVEDQALNEMIHAWTEQLTPENIEEYAARVESTVQTLTPDSEGYVSYEYELEGRGSGSGSVLTSAIFKDGKLGMSDNFDITYSDKGFDSLMIETFTKNEDGTVTYAVYIPKL